MFAEIWVLLARVWGLLCVLGLVFMIAGFGSGIGCGLVFFGCYCFEDWLLVTFLIMFSFGDIECTVCVNVFFGLF